MKPIQSKVSGIAFILTLFAIIFAACQKDIGNDYQPPVITNPIDQTIKVGLAKVSGFVTLPNGQPATNADVVVGNKTTTTNAFGYFEVRNADVVKSAGVVTANKLGYFPGIRTFVSEAGKSAFVRIQLIEKNTTGSFEAASGGTITANNGFTLNFPASSIVVEATGAAYTGTVNVAAYWINPAGQNLQQEMPGDLRGITTEGSTKHLTSYGMAAVELRSPSGEKLQMASGKTAAAKFPIPPSLGNAPVSMPMWYFDEAKGLWKEEGACTKNGSFYEANLAHFSFWNCDVPNDYVQVSMNLLSSDNQPLAGTFVRIFVTGNPQQQAWGYTDSTGYVAGAVPSNTNLTLELFSYYNCGAPVYTQTFSTTSGNLSLGNIVVPATSSNLATTSGTVNDCSGNPLASGYVYITTYIPGTVVSSGFNVVPVTNGTFQFQNWICSNTQAVQLVAMDNSTMQQSANTTSFTLVPGANTIPLMTACGTTTQEFINVTVDGTQYAMQAPADSVSGWNSLQGQIYVNGFSSVTQSNVAFSFSTTGIGVGTTQALMGYTNLSPTVVESTTSLPVNITEYGAIGQFVAGNFSGTLTNSQAPNATHDVTVSFRFRRNN